MVSLFRNKAAVPMTIKIKQIRAVKGEFIIVSALSEIAFKSKIYKCHICTGKEHEESNYKHNIRGGKSCYPVIPCRKTSCRQCGKRMANSIKNRHSAGDQKQSFCNSYPEID